ncbi:MAG: phenylalanine--tRNA ligase subunit beta [Proteobacteria bacterium]|nr:phenylalanine--tRNA ligase subunit beta [Pseudomonadota bacterium]
MLLSHRWISQIAGFAPDPAELADKLTFGGLEVDAARRVGADLGRVVVGVVASKRPHPTRPNLSCVEVDGGAGLVAVVCGAPNCPGPGGLVALALVGARVGGIEVAERELQGERSLGMLCSELELGVGPDHDGVLLLEGLTRAAPGTPLAAALDLEDWIYDVSVTPNRPDALSHRGVAREVALLYGRPFSTVPAPRAPEGGDPVDKLARVDLLDPAGCPRYAAAVVSGAKIGPSPFAVRYRLHNLGVRPIGNAVDVTNLAMLEWGQPLHAFDLDKLAGRAIAVRRAREGERMRTLDGVERVFAAEDLLICDGERPVAVAGVMGGEDTGVTASTRNVLIECAYFDPRSIRRTSRRLKLQSESSYRFERGVDPLAAIDVLESAASAMAALCGAVKAPGNIDRYPTAIERRRAGLRDARFAHIMGYRAEPEETRRVLDGIGCDTTRVDGGFEVVVPAARPDLTREIDLIEEVARVLGLARVPSRLPRIQSRSPDRVEFDAARRSKEALASYGLDEAVCYSFVPEALLARLGMDRAVVRIANPLNAERAAMRTTLVAGLLENLKRATTRYEPQVRQFEVGRTFHDEGGELPREVLRAAVLVAGPRDAWIGEAPGSHDVFDAKGIALALIRDLTGAQAIVVPRADVPFLHPARGGALVVDGVEVGVVGELHPELLGALKLERGAACFEIDVLALRSMRRRPTVSPLSEFPPSVRDVALLVAEEQDAGPVAEALGAACGPLAVGVRLFDVYRGKGIEAGKKSLAFTVVYRAFDRTLTDDEIDAAHKPAVAKVAVEFRAIVR